MADTHRAHPVGPITARIVWVEAERYRRNDRATYMDSDTVCAARLRLVNREADRYQGGYKVKRRG